MTNDKVLELARKHCKWIYNRMSASGESFEFYPEGLLDFAAAIEAECSKEQEKCPACSWLDARPPIY